MYLFFFFVKMPNGSNEKTLNFEQFEDLGLFKNFQDLNTNCWFALFMQILSTKEKL